VDFRHTISAHHVRNSIELADEVKTMIVQEDEVMVSFDVVSLFTKIPVELALEVTQRRLMACTEFENHSNWSIEDVCQGLKICLESTFLHFRGKNYKQVFGTAMGSPVSAVVANTVMEEIETRAIKTSIHAPRLCKRYVDDTFVLIEQRHLTNFADHIQKTESSIKFTMETETNGSIPFLDVLVKRGSTGQINTSMYRKTTHTGRYPNYRSEHPLQHKRSIVNTLPHRADTICNDEVDKQAEIAIIKTSLIENGYPERMIRLPKTRSKPKQKEETRSLAVLPYYPGLTDKLKRCLRSHDIKEVSKPIRKFGDILGSTKEAINKNLRQRVIYSIPCHDCDQRYIGETQWCTRRGFGRPPGLKNSGQTLFSGQAQVAQKF